MDGNIVPIGEVFTDGGCALGIISREIVERLVREDHTPAERVICPIALDHDDVMRRIAQLHGDREIEPGRTATQTRDTHEQIPPRPTRCEKSKVGVWIIYFKPKYFDVKMIDDSSLCTLPRLGPATRGRSRRGET